MSDVLRAQEDETRAWREDGAARALSELPDRDWGPCQFTVTDVGPCGHDAESHGTDREVDLDGRGKGPEYLVCFECLDEERPHWSHDFDGGPDLREVLRRYYIFEKEIDGVEQLEREFGPPEYRGSSISEEAWLERVLREPARRILGIAEARNAR